MKKKQDAYIVYVPSAVSATFTRRLFAADAILDEVTDERGGILHYLCHPTRYEAVWQAMRKEAREA